MLSRTPRLPLLILAVAFIMGGCKSNPSTPSPSSPSQSPPPSGQDGSRSSSGNSGEPTTSSSDGRAQGAQEASTQDGSTQPSGDGSKQTSTGDPATDQPASQSAETGQASGDSASGQSEDQVLSEAMEVFDESMRKQQETGTTSGGSGTDSETAPILGQEDSGTGRDGTAGGVSGNQSGTTADGTDQAGDGTTTGDPAAVQQDGGGDETRPGGAGDARTDAERREELDRKLNRELAQFDGIILERQREVSASDNESGGGRGRAAAGTGSAGGGYAGDGGGDSAPLLTATAEESGNIVTRGNQPDMPGDQREGDYKRGDTPQDRDDRIPEDIPSGDDDDIVARQLREAAMEEEDPELREKLWDEYRKYKEGVQAKR